MHKLSLVLAYLAIFGHGRRVQTNMEQLAAFNPSAPAARLSKGSPSHATLHPTALDRSKHHSHGAPVMSQIPTQDLEDSVRVTVKKPSGESELIQREELSPESSEASDMHNMMGMAAAAALAAATVAMPEPSEAVSTGAITATAVESAGNLAVQIQQLCAKTSFAGLMTSTSIYWGRAAGFGGGVEGKGHGIFGTSAMAISSLSLAALLSARWVESGHFPLSNMYESLLFLGWGVTAIHFWVAKTIPKSAVAGALTSPLALLITGGATLALPAELQKASALVPALKSNWLMMHVSVMMMSYATLLAGSLVAGAFLFLTAPEDGFVGKARVAATQSFAKLTGQAAGDEEHAEDAAAAAAAAAAASEVAAAEPLAEPMAASSQIQTSNSNPWDDIQAGNVATIAQPVSSTSQPLSETCNDLAYQCSFLGFVFLTLGLISGAVWANEAWGSYWSWDPKETWALIVWLVYVAYLHTRLSPQYTDRFSNLICFSGFAVTWICYVGVNLFGVGLHSYGWLANK